MKIVAATSVVLLALGGWSLHAFTPCASQMAAQTHSGAEPSANASVAVSSDAPLTERATVKLPAQASADLGVPVRQGSLSQVLEGDDTFRSDEVLGTMVREHRADDFAQLLETDLSRVPESASSVIQSVAAYAARGNVSEQTQAVRTLRRWLSEDAGRPGVYAAANMPTLVEAIAEVGGAGARDALVSLLEGGKAELSVETLAVQKLGTASSAAERAAVAGFLERVRALPEAQGIERELQAEAIEAGVEALKEAKRR